MALAGLIPGIHLQRLVCHHTHYMQEIKCLSMCKRSIQITTWYTQERSDEQEPNRYTTRHSHRLPRRKLHGAYVLSERDSLTSIHTLFLGVV